MNAPTNIQMINGPDGKPAYVVMPYAEFIKTYARERDLIPHEVVSATVDGATPVRAWREYLKLTQAEVAGRLGISQPSYAKQEGSESLRPATMKKIAVALGISADQLDF
ncbi:MAG: helix-turn-helix transcriptional regulator [Burkholderiaceae bacterium]|nr:helix-turn-helix transcriptional regulator [Burkholderiaceae bacterium]